MIGAGKYDDICALARDVAQAQAALLILIDGAKGTGFSVQGPLMVLALLPEVLRKVADEIEADLKDGRV